jgi:GntR family transcriptional regulator/MocR family aminotransferase
MPVASLQGLDAESRVIYIGTFSKVLFPSLRIGYVVLPLDLVDHFVAVRKSIDLTAALLYQAVLTDFIREGHFARHIRRMRMLYDQRRTALVERVREEFDGTLQIRGAQAGMHLLVELPKGFHDLRIAKEAARRGLWLAPLSSAYLEKPSRQGLVLGFGGTPVAEMSAAVRQLKSVLPGQAEP